MSNPNQKIDAASEFLFELIKKNLGNTVDSEHAAVHPETAIASAARLSGTMIFRTLKIPADLEPGTPVLSEEANAEGPKMMNVMFHVLQNLGHDVAKLDKPSITTEVSQLTLLQTQERLEPEYLAYCGKAGLSFQEAAMACAVCSAVMIHQCGRSIPIGRGVALAFYGMVEGSKTTPWKLPNSVHMLSLGLSTPASKTKPWWKFW